jgi:hypothetical protein
MLHIQKKHKHSFWHLVASCLETGKATIPQINPDLYSVSRTIVQKFQKDQSTRKSHLTDTIFVQTHDDRRHLTDTIFVHRRTMTDP